MLYLRNTSNITGYTSNNPTATMALMSLTRMNYYISTEMGENTTEIKFTVDLIDVLDRVMVENDLKLSTESQVELFNMYLSQADTGLIDDILIQLDKYLGSYVGEENDTYFRLVYRTDNL